MSIFLIHTIVWKSIEVEKTKLANIVFIEQLIFLINDICFWIVCTSAIFYEPRDEGSYAKFYVFQITVYLIALSLVYFSKVAARLDIIIPEQIKQNAIDSMFRDLFVLKSSKEHYCTKSDDQRFKWEKLADFIEFIEPLHIICISEQEMYLVLKVSKKSQYKAKLKLMDLSGYEFEFKINHPNFETIMEGLTEIFYPSPNDSENKQNAAINFYLHKAIFSTG
jgi:hypothetical protein